jgi:exodeoxyribonuclease-3
MPLKLISWNVNGLRAVFKKGLVEMIHEHQPDILCLQETKMGREIIELAWPEGYTFYLNSGERPGYSGTGILSRVAPLSVRVGTTGEDDPKDIEGRVQTLEFETFYLVNVYTPNSGNELARLPFRQQEWDPGFLAYLKGLEKKKPVVFCGDLNVAAEEIDLARPKQNVKNAGFTPEERAGFAALRAAGFVDTFREFEKGPGHYTWWSFRAGARGKNVGWRIDYFLISPELRPRLQNAFILKDVLGSDHCPVGIDLAE